MSHYNNYKEHKKAIFDELILSGYTKNYIRRALKVYERNYGLNYNIEVIAEIVRRLQKKDRNKAKLQRRHHLKSHSETFEFPRSFTPKKHGIQSKESIENELRRGLKVSRTQKDGTTTNTNTESENEEDKEAEDKSYNVKRMHIKSSRSLNSKEWSSNDSSSHNNNHIRSKTSYNKINNDKEMIHRWINTLNDRHDDALLYLNEIKEYILSNKVVVNWQYLIKYNLLGVLTRFIGNVLSSESVSIWHKWISVSLDILSVLIDYYLKMSILIKEDVIGCIICIMGYHCDILDYNVCLCSILISCCSILGKLTFENVDNIDCVVNLDGIDCIFLIIGKSRELSIDSLIICSLNLLCVLCYNSDSNRSYICDNGGSQCIIDLLSYYMSLSYHISGKDGDVLMINSILRSLGNFTFCGSSIMDDSLISILSSLIDSVLDGCDSNMLVLLMQIMCDIAHDIGVNRSSWIMSSMLSLSVKNGGCLLLQQCMINGIAILISENSVLNSKILLSLGGEMVIFDCIRSLNYPSCLVILSLRLIGSICVSSSYHLVSESNLFNYLTHCMKHCRLNYDSDSDSIIVCCCRVLRSLNMREFSKYASRCHVISGLIKILMLNCLSSCLWNEILKTFIAICIDEENCLKLAKHGLKYIINLPSSLHCNLCILLYNLSRYCRVCSLLIVYMEYVYSLLSSNTDNVLICNSLILFLSNILSHNLSLYNIKYSSLINKILYLHSNSDRLIASCHHYHKCVTMKLSHNENINEISLFLNNNNNWDLVTDSNSDQSNTLFKCCAKQLGINGWKECAKHVYQYKIAENDYFGHLLCSNNDYITLIALFELYSVRIRVFNAKLSLLFDIGSFLTNLPCIYLAFLNGCYYLINRGLNIDYSREKRDLNIDLKQYRFHKFYAKLFNYFDSDCSGDLRGEEIYDFFLSSSLSTDILRTIWDESVGDNNPTMNLDCFIISMRLILQQQIANQNYNKKHGSFNKIAKSNTKCKIKQNTKHKLTVLSRTSANDIDDAATNHLISVGIPIMEYPINPFDLNQFQTNKTTQSDDTTNSEIKTNTNSTNLNRKTDEFIKFFNQINFGDADTIYYEKIAQFEYNDIEKMMQLDIDILCDDIQMNQHHANLFINKLRKFHKNHKIFKKWLNKQCKMRRYFVKFINEGILTIQILLTRCKSINDLLQIIGTKNVIHANIIWKNIPRI